MKKSAAVLFVAHLASAHPMWWRNNGIHSNARASANLHSAPEWPVVNAASNDANQSDSRGIAPHGKDSHRLGLWQLSSTASWLPTRTTIFSGCGSHGLVQQQHHHDSHNMGHVLQRNVDHA